MNLTAVGNLSKVENDLENKVIIPQNEEKVTQSITLTEITDFTNKWAAAWRSKKIFLSILIYIKKDIIQTKLKVILNGKR